MGTERRRAESSALPSLCALRRAEADLRSPHPTLLQLCYWSAVASQDSRGLPDRMPGRRWIVPANQPHRAVERDEAKHQRRFRFLADWITAERKRGVIVRLPFPLPRPKQAVILT